MRKFFSVCALMAVSIICFFSISSCVSDVDSQNFIADVIDQTRSNPVSSMDVANQAMLSSMDTYNNDLPDPDIDYSSPLRVSFWKKIGVIASLDCLGALIGVLTGGGSEAIGVGAVTLSGSAASTLFLRSINPDPSIYMESAKAITHYEALLTQPDFEPLNYYPYNFNYIPSNYRNVATDMGKLHNESLEIFRNGSAHNLSTSLVPRSLLNATRNQNLLDACNTSIRMSLVADTIFTDLSGIEKDVFDRFYVGLKYANDQSDVEELVNTYANYIEINTFLPARKKDGIYKMLVVGAYSYDYWYNNYCLEMEE